MALSGQSLKCRTPHILHDISPADIAYDPLRNHIYWSDLHTKKIYLTHLIKNLWAVVVWKNLNLPSSIALAYNHG